MNPSTIPNLTEHEKSVLKLVASGLTNKAIAQSLKITPRTVEFHLSNIFKKLDVSSRTLAVLFAEKNGLLEK